MSQVPESVEISPSDVLIAGNIRGAEYIYPERMDQLRKLHLAIAKVAKSWGYKQVDGPTLQPIEFYKIKSSDDILKEGYYISSGDKTYILRPETTPTIAYMLAKAEKRLSFPVRWYSDSDIYRNERPQSGRKRQFGQFNLDKFEKSPLQPNVKALSDAEVIVIALDILTSLGLTSKDLVLKINSRSLIEKVFEVLNIESSVIKYQILSAIDAKSKIPADVFEERLINAGLKDLQIEGLKQWMAINSLEDISKNDKFKSVATSAEYKELQEVFVWIANYGFSEFCIYDPATVRGLGYYTGTVFEAYDRTPEKSMNRSILGGGRYDNFTKKFGGKTEVTGVGFGIGFVPLEILLESRNLMPKTKDIDIDYYIVSVHDDDSKLNSRLQEILGVAKTLRDNHYSVIIDPSITLPKSEKMKKQISTADKIGSLKILIFFANEDNKDKVVIKDLKSGEQEEIKVNQFINTLKQENNKS
jgi:histidyl-tRNA synthetase